MREPGNMLHSLRGRLALSHLAVIFLATLVTGFALLSLVRGYFLDAIEASLEAQADLIGHTILPNEEGIAPSTSLSPAYNTLQQGQVGGLSVQVAGGEPPADPQVQSHLTESNLAALADTSLQIASALQTDVRIIDVKGIVLLDSSGGQLGTDRSADPLVSAAMDGDREAEIRSGTPVSEMHVAVPLISEGTVAGVITLSQPLNDVAAVLSDLRTLLLWAAGLATIIAGGIGLLLAGGISRPLAALTLAADKLRTGDFDHPIRVDGRDELAQLAESFSSMRERMKDVEKMRVRFVSDVSHELRTPLTSIKGLTETLREGAVDDPEVRDRFLTSIEGETDRLIRLVNDLLILSRADSQRNPLRREQTDLKALVNSTHQLFSTQLRDRAIKLTKQFPTGALSARVDPDRMSQVLFNLLDNACEHTPTGGEIWVTAGEIMVAGRRIRIGNHQESAFPSKEELPSQCRPLADGSWLLVAVRDTGSGVSAKDLAHVFERFYRADKSRARDRGGSGLGLPIAKAIVEAHDGQIWLESPGRDHPPYPSPGTCAFVTLPHPR